MEELIARHSLRTATCSILAVQDPRIVGVYKGVCGYTSLAQDTNASDVRPWHTDTMAVVFDPEYDGTSLDDGRRNTALLFGRTMDT